MSMNSPPHFLLDALNDSITSGTFIDTKFYVFSRRDASGRVGTPRPSYCNSRTLDTVPYFSTLFSDGFVEGQTRDINEGFPSDSTPYTEHYEYSSDSDLEDEYSCSEEDGDDEQTQHPQDSDSQLPPIVTSETSLRQSSCDHVEIGHNHHWPENFVKMGKVAIIRDMAAVTFESMIYFLYTGKITFAPFNSDPHHELPAEERAGDWTTARIPSPSAKSVYRLADKYDMPVLKEQAKTHILNNLAHCNIVDEVFSSFSLSFPEMLSVQVSHLVGRVKDESTEDAESDTRRLLREKIAALSQPQLARATDVLAMIWDFVVAPPEPSKPVSTKLTPPLIWHWSIPTGTFIDVRFYAYDVIRDNLPVDPKPLFTSSIVISEWESAIMKQTAGVDSRDACLMDGLTDDYECWLGELPETLHNDKPALKNYIEVAATTASCKAAVLIAGARKTWMSLFSYAYTNEMTFAPLQTSAHNRDPVAGFKTEWNKLCSPRSMYSLATALEIEEVKENALTDLRSKLGASNIGQVAQELFTTFAANNKEIMDMEIECYKNSPDHDPKLLTDHILAVVSGETPTISTTLSLVYDKLVESVFSQPIASGSGLGKSTETREQSVAESVPTAEASNQTSGLPSPSQPHPSQPAPDPVPDPEPIPLGAIWLECCQCRGRTRLRDLHNGLRCPRCPQRPRGKGRPFMQCPACNLIRVTPKDRCVRNACQARFA